MKRVFVGVSVCLSAVVFAAGAAAQVGPFTGSDPLDLSSLAFISGERIDYPISVSDEGVVLGNTFINAPDGSFSLYSWRVEPGQPATQLGLRGSGFEFPNNRRFDTIFASNGNGRVAGYSTRVDPAGVDPLSAADAWVFDGVNTRRIGLTASDLNDPPGAIFGILGLPQEVTQAGDVLGTAVVYRDGGITYYAGWVANADGETTALLPPGDGFIQPDTGARNVQAIDMNDSGVVIGSALNYNFGFANVGFAYSNGVYRTLGLTGAPFEDPELSILTRTQPAAINNAGVIIGQTLQRLPGNLTGLWMDNGEGAVPVGLTSPVYQNMEFYQQGFLSLDEQGVAAGYALKLSVVPPAGLPASQSMFVVKQGVTTQIGLLDTQHQTADGYEYNAYYGRAKDGSVLGFAYRTDLPESTFGLTGWVYDPSRPTLGTVAPRLTGSQYAGPQGESLSYVTDARDGKAVGIQRIYVGDEDFWYAGFITDLQTGVVTPLIFEALADGRSRTYPLMVTERGGVFGYYTKFEDDGSGGDRPFYWSPRAGFVDLQPANAPPMQLGIVPQFVVSPDGTRVAIAGTLLTGDPGLLRVALPQEGCDSIDFNNDGLFPSDDDLTDFLSVLAGGTCSTAATSTLGCNDIDFNNDGLFPSDDDLIAYLRVLAGGRCE